MPNKRKEDNMTKKENFLTTYAQAVKWCNNQLIMCNELPEIDCSIFDNLIVDNNEEDLPEVFQWFITDCTEDDMHYLKNAFPDLIFTYSDLLNKYILCVNHWGTSWDYVSTTVNTSYEYAPSKEAIKTYKELTGGIDE